LRTAQAAVAVAEVVVAEVAEVGVAELAAVEVVPELVAEAELAAAPERAVMVVAASAGWASASVDLAEAHMAPGWAVARVTAVRAMAVWCRE
jgi:hypothetical protein